MFKICARTVLELGAELISSDVIAFYELIKNAFDAGSPTGAEIRLEITIRRNDYLRYRHSAIQGTADLDLLKADVDKALDPSAPPDSLDRFRATLHGADHIDAFISALDAAYAEENRIVVSDEGTGMSIQDLVDNYLVIGTPSRKRAIDAALAEHAHGEQRAPFLGEKGIGRLSAMRLGDMLTVETAQGNDKHLNLLSIDWSAFGDLDAMLDEIHLAPERSGAKPEPGWSGTRLTIRGLGADWTYDRVRHLGEHEFARLTDPFSDARRRPRVALFWNGTRVPVAHMDHHLLEHAHASVRGQFVRGESGPALKCRVEALNLGFEHSQEVEERVFTLPDLEGSIEGTSREVPVSALSGLGDFEFEIYWFNRQRLGAIDSIGDRNLVRELQRRWSGILLFRDGFRILPYGEDNDDWLALDRRALGSKGYSLNKAQFVGRVTISRLANPFLVDQTNREGLRVCPEQEAFINLLQFAIQDHFRFFLQDVRKRHKGQPLDMTEVRTDVADLEKRAIAALRKIKRLAPHSAETVEELRNTLLGIKEFLDRSQARIDEVESENRQMIQIAGVGLLVEVVAHELARSTENTLAALEALRGREMSDQMDGLLTSLRSEMTAVSKRLRVLDPLSVSGRQRKESFDLGRLISDVLSGHEMQFERHKVKVTIRLPETVVRIYAVKGMIVQIIENLISNSLYWLDLRRQNERDFHPSITVSVTEDPVAVTYADNGRGVAPENRDKVFRAFFSLKEKSKRRGLGLYIGRECAEYHGGTLTLDNTVDCETGRLHRFLLELPDQVVVT